jgi:proteic killer suppression protein
MRTRALRPALTCRGFGRCHRPTEERCKGLGSISKVATRKLAQLDAAETLAFLASPPGNRPDALAGERQGQHSIRINDPWRVGFRRAETGPEEIEMVEYH